MFNIFFRQRRPSFSKFNNIIKFHTDIEFVHNTSSLYHKSHGSPKSTIWTTFGSKSNLHWTVRHRHMSVTNRIKFTRAPGAVTVVNSGAVHVLKRPALGILDKRSTENVRSGSVLCRVSFAEIRIDRVLR